VNKPRAGRPGFGIRQRRDFSSVKLITHLQLVPRLRMRGALTPFSLTSSWRGA